MGATEQDELRALQAKAYGRGGELTDAEAERLAELQAVAPARAAEPEQAPEPEWDAEFDWVVEPEWVAEDAARDERAPASRSEAPEEPGAPGAAPRRRVPRRALLAAASAVLLLAAGLGGAWTLFADRSGEVSLTAAEQERRLELEEGKYLDEGSVRPIGRDGNALVWYATKSDGKSGCLILDVGELHGGTDICQPVDEIGVSASGYTTMGFDVDDEQVTAMLARNAAGKVVAVVQRYPAMSEGRWVDQLPEQYRGRAQELLDAGYDEYSPSLIGMFDEQPVWSASRTQTGSTTTCLIVDALGQEQCVAFDENTQSIVIDADDGSSIELVLPQMWWIPQLVITEAAG